LIAGILVGPHTPGYVANTEWAEQLAEVGVVLLMFGVGLHFRLRELLAVRGIAIPGAIGQSLVATALGALTAHAFGWDWAAGVVFGLAISVASTVVLTRVLSDNRDLHTPTGHIAIGWLVVEDLLTVIVLVLLPVLFGPEAAAGPAHVPLALGLAALKIAALGAFTFLVGGHVIPRILDRIAATRSRELFTLAILVLALGISVGSAKLFGVSIALGAFLAGMVVGRSDFSLRAASEALPMRDAFAVLFFVSVGMLLDPRYLLRAPALVAATLAVILVGKPLAALAIVLLLRYPFRIALSVAVALAQIGEFSFILATLGRQLGILTTDATHAIVAAAIFSIGLNPLLYRLVRPIERWATQRPVLWRWLNARTHQLPPAAPGLVDGGSALAARYRAVVVGYGPVGRTVTRILQENGIEPAVIELNLDIARQLREIGVPITYGDASHRDTLQNAGVERAGSLILSASGISHSEEVIRLARELNPAIRIFARTAYLRELPTLLRSGASRVFSGEGEVALALTEALLRELGASPEQIDRERERVRGEILPGIDVVAVERQSRNSTMPVDAVPPDQDTFAK
jgi:CPA2 family monovalent cation:H+ antiporter-2